MGTRWSAEQVLALAPDAASVAAGRKLAVPAAWSGLGASSEPAAVWGQCRGSGKIPYRTAVDRTGPAFSCSCPSRKFPCKHALGLLLLWAGGEVPDIAGSDASASQAMGAGGWVRSWLDSRAERSGRGAHAERAARAARAVRSGPGPAADGEVLRTGDGEAGADPAAARRAERRRERMLTGLAELEQWLTDQVRAGLATTSRVGYGAFETVAARMVDAQLPGVASALRRLPSVLASGDGWPGRLLEEYALAHLLATAGSARLAGDASVPVSAAVGAHLGLTVSKDEVLAGPPVRDRWAVLGLRDEVEERLAVRRMWLRGERSGRIALVLSYAVAGRRLDAGLVPGTAVEADLHFYPGDRPLRALVGVRHESAEPPGPVPGEGLGEALQQWSQALADDPWTPAWPVVVAGAVPVSVGERWRLVVGEAALPLVGQGESVWTLVAVCGGLPNTVLAEIVPGGIRVISVLQRSGDRPVTSVVVL